MDGDQEVTTAFVDYLHTATENVTGAGLEMPDIESALLLADTVVFSAGDFNEWILP